MEKDSSYLLEEAVSAGAGIPMTEQQTYYLHEFVDPQIEKLMAELDKEIQRRKDSDEYQRRTLPFTHI